MRGKSLALLILALGCGLVASLGITQVMAKRGDSTPTVDTAPVYVAKADIPLGALVTADYLKVEQWPKDKVPVGSLSQREELDGRRARYKVFAGQTILDPMLMRRGEVPTDGLIPKDLRVVAIPIGPEAIHSGLVVPGSRCDVQVFMRADPSIGVAETMCKTILQDIRVFAVNDITSTESIDPKAPDTVHSIPTGKTVSLLVTPVQAQIVTLASQLGTVRLILRSGEDKDQVKCDPVPARELISALGGGNRAVEMKNSGGVDNDRFNQFYAIMKKALERSAAAGNVAKPAEPAKFTMRVRAGTELSEVLMVANAGSNTLPGDEGVWTTASVPAATKTGGKDHAATPAATKAPTTPLPAANDKPKNEPPPALPKATGKPLMGS